MKWTVTVAVLALWPAGAAANFNTPLIRNPVLLNIGFVCRWQSDCIRNQATAMKHSLKYVEKYDPPTWKIQQCNRNASRNGTRVDWVGFGNCVRNPSLRPEPRIISRPVSAARRKRRSHYR